MHQWKCKDRLRYGRWITVISKCEGKLSKSGVFCAFQIQVYKTDHLTIPGDWCVQGHARGGCDFPFGSCH